MYQILVIAFSSTHCSFVMVKMSSSSQALVIKYLTIIYLQYILCFWNTIMSLTSKFSIILYSLILPIVFLCLILARDLFEWNIENTIMKTQQEKYTHISWVKQWVILESIFVLLCNAYMVVTLWSVLLMPISIDNCVVLDIQYNS